MNADRCHRIFMCRHVMYADRPLIVSNGHVYSFIEGPCPQRACSQNWVFWPDQMHSPDTELFEQYLSFGDAIRTFYQITIPLAIQQIDAQRLLSDHTADLIPNWVVKLLSTGTEHEETEIKQLFGLDECIRWYEEGFKFAKVKAHRVFFDFCVEETSTWWIYAQDRFAELQTFIGKLNDDERDLRNFANYQISCNHIMLDDHEMMRRDANAEVPNDRIDSSDDLRLLRLALPRGSDLLAAPLTQSNIVKAEEMVDAMRLYYAQRGWDEHDERQLHFP